MDSKNDLYEIKLIFKNLEDSTGIEDDNDLAEAITDMEDKLEMEVKQNIGDLLVFVSDWDFEDVDKYIIHLFVKSNKNKEQITEYFKEKLTAFPSVDNLDVAIITEENMKEKINVLESDGASINTFENNEQKNSVDNDEDDFEINIAEKEVKIVFANPKTELYELHEKFEKEILDKCSKKIKEKKLKKILKKVKEELSFADTKKARKILKKISCKQAKKYRKALKNL